jgi:hypothetical protein
MALNTAFATLFGPPAVAVHDDRDMLGQTTLV